jgi:hypothetical protein
MILSLWRVEEREVSHTSFHSLDCVQSWRAIPRIIQETQFLLSGLSQSHRVIWKVTFKLCESWIWQGGSTTILACTAVAPCLFPNKMPTLDHGWPYRKFNYHPSTVICMKWSQSGISSITDYHLRILLSLKVASQNPPGSPHSNFPFYFSHFI